MDAYRATLLNGCTLMLMSAWSFFATQSFTAFIPAAFGLAFLLMAGGVRAENKVIAHVAVVLVTVAILLLIPPLLRTIDGGNTAGTIRVGLMLLTSVIALVYYIKSFIDARRARA